MRCCTRVQSPPMVVGDVVINGSSISDRRVTMEAIPGWVRAWDVRTGKHRWDFRPIPRPGEEGVETWKNDSWSYSGNANVWSMMSADEELGYVYLPTTTPTNDYYGGHRLGRQPVCREPGVRGRQDRQEGLAFSGGASRPVGLRLSRRADAARHRRGRQADQGGGAGQQTGLRLHVRQGDRKAGVADRGEAGADRDERARRSAVEDAAVPDQAAGVRVPGRHDRRSRGFHAGDPADGDRGRQGLHDRSAVHAADARRAGEDEGDDFQAVGERRRQLVGGRRRSRDRHAVRAVEQRRDRGHLLCAEGEGRQPALHARNDGPRGRELSAHAFGAARSSSRPIRG